MIWAPGTGTGWYGSPTLGSPPAANRADPTRGGGRYIHAEKMRHTNADAADALACPGRYHDVADKTTCGSRTFGCQLAAATASGRAERLVVCHKPGAADCHAAVLIDGSDA